MKGSSVPVSVVIPAYKAAPYLEETVESVRRQSVAVDEIVVVDDGSSDDTVRVAESLDVRLVRHDRNRGVSAARNSGVRAAENEWIALLDADDIWKQHKMERQWQVVERHSAVELVFTDEEHVHDGEVVSPYYLDQYESYRALERTELGPNVYRLDGLSLGTALLPGNFLKPSTLLFQRDIFEKAGAFDENFTAPDSPIGTCEDHDLALRLCVLTNPVAVEEPLVSYHPRDGGLSSDRIGMLIGYAYLAQKITDNRGRYPPGATEYFREHRPDWLRSAAVRCMHDDRFDLASSLLKCSLRDRVSPRTLAALAICSLGSGPFQVALHLKRLIGLPGLR